MSQIFSMGEASSSTGLSPDALRYYEANGIIGPFARDMSNHREFTQNDIAWIGVITCMRNAGLGISDLRSFADILRNGDTSEDPTIFLKGRRAILAARADALAQAIVILDEKIEHFSRSAIPHARIHVHGHLRCRDDDEAQTVSANLDEHTKLTRAEPGCISFTVTPTSDPLVWSVDEWFVDSPALTAHRERVAASDWGQLTKNLGHDYQITEE